MRHIIAMLFFVLATAVGVASQARAEDAIPQERRCDADADCALAEIGCACCGPDMYLPVNKRHLGSLGSYGQCSPKENDRCAVVNCMPSPHKPKAACIKHWCERVETRPAASPSLSAPSPSSVPPAQPVPVPASGH